jgi:uncharacterized RDD family membrane protein YckC
MSTQGESSFDPPGAAGQVQTDVNQRPLASRLARLGAAIVDGILGLVIALPIGYATGYLQRVMDQTASLGEMAGQGVAGMVIFLALHGYFLATRGQTIGKMAAGVRIVDFRTGQLLSIGKLIGLRVVPVWVASVIPFAGGCLALIDILFIFGNDRRCVHDLIAGTKVVQA